MAGSLPAVGAPRPSVVDKARANSAPCRVAVHHMMATTSQPQPPAVQIYDHGSAEREDEDQADKQPSNRTSEGESVRTAVICTNRAGLVANTFLLLGYTFALWFQVYDFTDRSWENIAIAVYFVAFALLILSAFIELGIDCFSVRTTGHGRYHGDSARWNRFVSVLFIAAGILDMVAFVFWMERDNDTENMVLLISSYVLLVMAILALYFQVQDVREQSWPGTITSDRIDLAANGIVFILSVVGVVLRHMQTSTKDFDDADDRLEMATVPIWLFTAVMYVTTDVIRVKTGVTDI